MGEEESAAAEGTNELAPSGAGAREGGAMRRDGPSGTLAAGGAQAERRLSAVARGNEVARNDRSPPTAGGTDPRRRRAEVGAEDELELSSSPFLAVTPRLTSLKRDEQELFRRMLKVLDEDAATIIDVPGVPQLDDVPEPSLDATGGGAELPNPMRRRGACEEGIPPYIERLEERVRDDMIALGCPPQEQELSSSGDCHGRKRNIQKRLHGICPRVEGRPLRAPRRRGRGVPAPAPRECRPMRQVEALQPVEIRLRCLNAVRDKLPRGEYAVSVTLRSRLGGRTLSRALSQAAPTEPVAHGGHFHDTKLLLNQSVFAALPSAGDLVPTLVLHFELLSLPGENSHISAVEGWGAFPVCDCGFRVIQGKFKAPLLRGPVDPALTQFRRIEELMASDLDNWLCNLYFQVKKLPGGSLGQEFTVDLQNLCGLPLRPPLCFGSFSVSPQGQGRVTPEPAEPTGGCLPANGETGPCREKDGDGGKPRAEHGTRRRSRPPGDERPEVVATLCDPELDDYKFSVQAQHRGGGTAERARLALCVLGLELGLSHGARCHLGLHVLLLALVWFPRLYLHYCAQWLFLHAIAVPISRFQFHPHTVELVYQNSLLRTREELAVVVVGPLTLNAATLLLVLIRWGCQLTFGSVPSFLSKFIMALGVWTVFDPLAVFAVDAVLGRLTYSAQRPIGDAAKLAWHFHGTQRSHLPGILITLFLYTVLLFCSLTILYIYFLRFHDDGCLLDIFQRLHGVEGSFFVPQDLEVSNQELSYIISKAEQWRGFGGERRKVAVYDYVWTEDTLSHHDTSSTHPPHGSRPPNAPPPRGPTSTHVAIYTLHPSGFREAYRHFLRQPSGAIVEVTADRGAVVPPQGVLAGAAHLGQVPAEADASRSTHRRCARKKKRAAWRSHRVEPAGRSCSDPNAAAEPRDH